MDEEYIPEPGEPPYATPQGACLFEMVILCSDAWVDNLPFYIDDDPDDYEYRPKDDGSTKHLNLDVRSWLDILAFRLRDNGRDDLAGRLERAFIDVQILALRFDQTSWEKPPIGLYSKSDLTTAQILAGLGEPLDDTASVPRLWLELFNCREEVRQQNCPKCGKDTKVAASPAGIRRFKCKSCGHPFSRERSKH
jgi:hypothetical protein